MHVEHRLIVCYMFGEPEPFENAWHRLTRLHHQYGHRLFLYKFGARLLNAPRVLADCRLLALIMREETLRTLSDEALHRLLDLLQEEDASFISNVPGILTQWFADLSEWREVGGEKPTAPHGIVLEEPTPAPVLHSYV